jgi:hypothetical protein
MGKREILIISLLASILVFLLISGCTSYTAVKEEIKADLSENTEDTILKEDPESDLSENTADTAEKEDLKSDLPENLNYTIDISGGTKGNITLTYSDLKTMDFVKRSNVTYYDSTGNKTVSDFIGIDWNNILEKGGVPAEAYFKVYSPDGYNIVYTGDQADDTILAFIENDKTLTADLKNDPIRLVYMDGKQCHWVTLPVKIEISSTNPDEASEMENGWDE